MDEQAYSSGNRNIIIIIVILVLVVVLAYLVWLRNQFQPTVSPQSQIPMVEVTPTPTPIIIKEASSTAKTSPAKTATPSSSKK